MASEILKRTNDVYVTLAFAAADVLMELDGEGRIVFAVGASMTLLGRPARLLADTFVEDLVAESDHDRLDRALEAMLRGERVRNVMLEIQLPEGLRHHVVFSGHAHPDHRDRLMVALAYGTGWLPRRRSTPSGLLDAEEFQAVANRLLTAPIGGDADHYNLTLLELPEMAGIRDAVGAEAAEKFAFSLGDRLKTLSAGGDAAGQFSDGKYGIIHTNAIDPGAIAEAVAAAAETCSVLAPQAKTASLVLDVAGMAAEDAARALAYTLNSFTATDTGGDLGAFAADLQPRLSATVNEMKAFRRVIEAGEFEMVYQPIVDLWTNVVHHFECLVRFGGSDRSPYETVTFAEDTGMAGELDMAVLERVVKMMRSAAGSSPALRFAVNLSGRSLSDSKVVAKLRAIVRDSSALSGRLMFEITESSAIGDLVAANAVVQDIRNQGFEVSLDDFGAGSAAFHYLRALKVDTVKIDGSYIKGCMENSENVAFIKAMVHLCAELRIATIAEYVEDAETAAMLKVLKVRYGQGWHFGKPHRPDLARAATDPAAWAPPRCEWRRGLLYFKG